jgi:hypothetical protein
MRLARRVDESQFHVDSRASLLHVTRLPRLKPKHAGGNLVRITLYVPVDDSIWAWSISNDLTLQWAIGVRTLACLADTAHSSVTVALFAALGHRPLFTQL